MNSRLTDLPLHPWLFGAYSVLQLLEANILQVDVLEGIRPLVGVLALTSLGYLACRQAFRSNRKGALYLSVLLLVVLSYGHLYQFFKATPVQGFNLGRHRYLAIAAVVLLAAAWRVVVRRQSDLRQVTRWANLTGLVLLAIPAIRLADHQIRAEVTAAGASQLPGAATTTDVTELPDIYYIILDGYARADALFEDFGFDNTSFLDSLQELGFYLADCSRSNYSETLSSLTSSLNMAYIQNLMSSLGERGLDSDTVFVLLKQNAVRARLEGMGYSTVAFQTGFDWTDWRDADRYIAAAQRPFDLSRVSPFEVLFLESTLARLLLDGRYLLVTSDLAEVEFRYGSHVELQRSLLEQLPRLPSVSGPTFTFAHVLIPHTPYVFAPDGSIQTDPGFFSGQDSGPVNEEYLQKGYIGEIQFINDRMLEIVEALIRDSDPPPIIMLQGDHGLRGEHRQSILNAYLFPDPAQRLLYPNITPVNSFRVLFSGSFGIDLDPLSDLSYSLEDLAEPTVDPGSACQGES